MRRSWVSRKDRARAVTAVVLVHAGVLAGLLTLGNPPDLPRALTEPLQGFDVTLPPPPPEPPPPEPVEVETRAAPEKEGTAAPPARKADATPVVAPEPRIVLPPRPTVTVAEKAGEGTRPSQGAAPVDGPGTGAGGQGSGTGSGGSGSGPGGGGGGGEAQRPALISRSLTQRDYSRSVRRDWPSGRRVLVSFDVQLDGRATGCRVEQTSGNPAIDAETCRLVTSRLRFRPARDRSGTPVVARYGYVQYPLF